MSHEEELFSSETLEQVTQRDGPCPISESVQGHFGQGCEQADLVDVPAHCGGIGLQVFLCT